MTQEHKELLLKDLCVRLPYNVICKDDNINVIGTLSQIGLHYNMCTLDKDNGESESCYIYNCKPYLFPLSSMTEEQREEYDSIIYNGIELHSERYYDVIDIDDFENLEEFYNKNHLDFRGLIIMGIAIDATGLNIY